MFNTRFSKVCIETFGMHMPDHYVSSLELEERIAPLYERLKVPFGTLEKLSGVGSRGFFPKESSPSVIATGAAREALDGLPFPREEIKALISCSVTRDYFEPATSMLVHRNLEMPEDTLAFDITNACIGFSDGLMMMAQMIESGQIKAGMVVTGENMGPITDATMNQLAGRDDLDRAKFLSLMPTFTLGSGGAAVVLCHESLATRGHRYLGSVSRAASVHNELCIGNGDFCYMQKVGLNPIMSTDSPKLIGSAAELGARTWADVSAAFGWGVDDIDTIFNHQVGKQCGDKFFKTMGLPIEKEFVVYPRYGNMVSAALPAALITGMREKAVKKGDKVLLTGFGSGLNAIFSCIEW